MSPLSRRHDSARRLGALSLLAVAAGWSAGALGQRPDANQLTVQLHGDVARVEVTPTADALPGVDDDGDGRLRPEELKRHRAELRARYERSVVLSSETREVAKVVFFDVIVPGGEAEVTTGRDHVSLRAQHQFASAPMGLVVDYAIFPPGPDAIVRATAGYRASPRDPVERLERVSLTRGQPRAVFFFTDALKPVGERLLAEASARRADEPELSMREGLALLMLGLALLIVGLLITRKGRPPKRPPADSDS